MKRIVLILALLAAAGCTTYKLWTESGASEEDGIVQLTYSYGRFENPQVDERGAIGMARERCAAWGFKGAKRRGEERICEDGLAGDCSRWRVVREYQCDKDAVR